MKINSKQNFQLLTSAFTFSSSILWLTTLKGQAIAAALTHAGWRKEGLRTNASVSRATLVATNTVTSASVRLGGQLGWSVCLLKGVCLSVRVCVCPLYSLIQTVFCVHVCDLRAALLWNNQLCWCGLLPLYSWLECWAHGVTLCNPCRQVCVCVCACLRVHAHVCT